MKRIPLLLIVGLITLLVSSCGPDGKLNSGDLYYTDVKAVVLKVGMDVGPDQTKFHNPTKYHILLARMISRNKDVDPPVIKDTTLFIEYEVDPGQYYGTEIGDTLHWIYVAKSRWFQITN